MSLKTIGKICQQFRMAHGYTQLDVANDTGYSIENVSSFERGRNDNYRILLWYLTKGITLEELMGDDN